MTDPEHGFKVDDVGDTTLHEACRKADALHDAAANALLTATNNAADALVWLMEYVPPPALGGPYRRAYEAAWEALDAYAVAGDALEASYKAHTETYKEAGYIT